MLGVDKVKAVAKGTAVASPVASPIALVCRVIGIPQLVQFDVFLVNLVRTFKTVGQDRDQDGVLANSSLNRQTFGKNSSLDIIPTSPLILFFFSQHDVVLGCSVSNGLRASIQM